jgi:hypothetical protein
MTQWYDPVRTGLFWELEPIACGVAPVAGADHARR